MTALPAVDLGIMAEHLTAHEGVINKLEVYQANVTNPNLKEIIVLQTNVMRAHVGVMLALIDPDESGYIEVPKFTSYSRSDHFEEQSPNSNNKWIALEAHTTAKCMSNENYVFALMRKDQNVRNTHVEMALQQLRIQEKLAVFIKNVSWAFVPHASVQSQANTYQHFQHTFDH